jgi:pSer/pThr/pTyr-binding forkhead associated (FHA) protein
MRIEFANAERTGIEWNRRELRIGSAADNDLVLDGAGVAPHHVRLLHDARGLTLLVADGAGRVYLNARQVRERALLRAGDNLGIGDHRLRLCRDGADGESVAVGAASLRVVAGPLSGRARSIGERLDLCNFDPWPLGLGHAPEACVSLVRESDGIHLHSRDLPEAVFLHVNGVVADHLRLRDGDQIAIGPHRFVLDACPASDGVPAASADEELPDPENSAGPRREVWWLIFTAALMALVISILFLV